MTPQPTKLRMELVQDSVVVVIDGETTIVPLSMKCAGDFCNPGLVQKELMRAVASLAKDIKNESSR